jgi:hypothetical protein
MPHFGFLHAYEISEHAQFEMRRRGISEAQIAQVLTSAEQIELDKSGRVVYQSRQSRGQPPVEGLLRVFVEINRQPPVIVTAYWTSKLRKYWRIEP